MVRKMWLELTWANLSIQATNLGLPSDTFFDTTTMLLSREINAKLWKQLVSLFSFSSTWRYLGGRRVLGRVCAEVDADVDDGS